MVRPKKLRRIWNIPNFWYFKPRGIPLAYLEEIKLTVDEIEAIRLKDLGKLEQVKAAKKMKVHQSTFNRVLKKAREKLADAIVNGKAIKIEGGNYKMVKMQAGRGFGRGRAGGPEKCICPSCGYTEQHIRGVPCSTKSCPKCGGRLIGKWD